MIALLIGISSGLLIILFIGMLKRLDKKLMYGLILSGIGFLYVGFTWSDLPALIVNAVQAILFIFLAYYGTKKSVIILAIGYFLHACWDIAYAIITAPGLIPPHYDLFCSSLDLTICIYLLVFNQRAGAKINSQPV